MTKTDPDFMRKLLRLVLPIAFQQFMLALVSASDALMLGALMQEALSAVSLAGQIAFVQNLFLAAMTIGFSALAAQYWGKGDRESVERVFAHSMKVTALVSFAFTMAALAAPEGLMRLFTNEAELIVGGAVYLRAASPSYVLTGISQICLCALKNSGRAGKSSLISAVSVVLNIALNAVLIFGLFGLPGLGIAGAALATVAARAAEVIWCAKETAGPDRVRLRLRDLARDDRVLRKDFWKYTAPVLGNEIVWGVGFTMYSVIMGHMGSDAVAANSIANIVKNLAACFCIGLGSGGGIMVGNELGAGRLEQARVYGGRLCRLAVLTGTAAGAALLLLTPLILTAAGLNGQSSGYLRGMLAVCSYYMIGKSVNATTIGGIFCAGGDSRFGFCCDAVTMWLVTVPLGFAAAFALRLPMPAVYVIISMDEIVKLPAVYRHYRKYQWVKDLTRKEETGDEYEGQDAHGRALSAGG
ncbi:MAG: MATE family efflux transporter [Eubacteriales bacterium]|nr:MATE family efflux transporter [Eubacteriales bacterium]